MGLFVDERLEGAAGRWAWVTVHESGSTLALKVEVQNDHAEGDAWSYRAMLTAEIALGYPALCTVNGRSSNWDLLAGDRFDDGPFKTAFWWVSHQLWDAELVETDDSTQIRTGESGWAEGPDHQQTNMLMNEICRRMAARAVTLCDQPARDAALRLPRDTRFFAYQAVLEDPSGRVEQMITVCPGLLVLAAAREPSNPWTRTLLDRVRRGHKLATLIAAVLPVATEHHRLIGSSVDLASSAVTLIKRAPVMSRTDLLHLLHAPGLDISDLSAAGLSSEAWFQTMVAWGHCARDIEDFLLAEFLGGFVSKHALEVQGMCVPGIFVEEIMDWLEGTGSTVPTRTASPQRVRRAIDDWHQNLHRQVRHDPETRLARAPMPSAAILGIEVTAIETVRQLVDEGTEMRHCVASFADSAIEAEAFFYRATIAGARITVAIQRSEYGWALREASGVANRPLAPDEAMILERWVDALPHVAARAA